MSFTYTRGVPNPPDDPSQDVGNMQTNTNSIDDWTQVDHIGFNNTLGGQHTKVTFPTNVTPAAPGALGSVAYTQPGSASVSTSQLLYQNSGITLPLSAVRAFGMAAGNGNYGPIAVTNGYNITSVSHSTPSSLLTVIMPVGVVTGTNYAVLCSCTQFGAIDQISITYSISSATQFTIKTVNVQGNVGTDVSFISFLVMQF